MTPRAHQSTQPIPAHLPLTAAIAVNSVEMRATIRPVTDVDAGHRPALLERRRRRFGRRVNH